MHRRTLTRRVWRALAAGCLALAAACATPDRTPDSVTEGRITVGVEPAVHGIVSTAADAFESLYPRARVEVRSGASREAVADLFAARSELAVVGREALPEEREAAVQGGIGIEVQRWARDAVAIVVHPDNPVEQLAFDDLREIYTGNLVSWSALGGRKERVIPIVQDPARSITQFFADRILDGAPITGPARTVDGDSAAVAAVARERGAVAFVTLPFAERGVRALRVARVKGLAYVELDARSVYEDRYPLTRFYNLFLRHPGSRLASGFTTFLCGNEGQRMVRDAGLVPATVPVRFTNRTPTISARRPAAAEEKDDEGR